jgi:dTMP kinase
VSQGRFITLEGGEGAGKSTQAALLGQALRQAGLEVLDTREPGGAPGAEAIRSLLLQAAEGGWEPMSELLLFLAARREHVTRSIRPALERGVWVVCDRFADSTMAYQGYAQGLGRDTVEIGQRLALGGFVPDLTLILDLPVEEGLARAEKRAGGETRYERMDKSFHQRLREGFLDIAQREPERCRVIDAAGPVEAVQRALRRAVAERFGIAL